MNKVKVLTVLIASLLCLVMILGAVTNSTDSLISGNSNSVNNSQGNNNPEDNNDNVNDPGVEPKPEEPIVVFGGRNLLTLDFEDTEYSNGSGVFYKDNINSSNAVGVTTYIEGGKFKSDFNYDFSNTSNVNFHFGFGIPLNSKDSCYSLADKDYFTYDVDYTVDNLYAEFKIYLIARSSSGVSSGREHSIYGTLDENGCITFRSVASPDAFLVINDSSFHLTAIFEVNHSDIYSSRMLYYINGNFFASSNYIGANAFEYCTFRFHCPNKIVNTMGAVYADNVSMNAFGDGSGDYDGSLAALFENPNVDLTDCVDSVLYKG